MLQRKIGHILQLERPVNFKLCRLLDSHDRRHARVQWPQRSKVSCTNSHFYNACVLSLSRATMTLKQGGMKNRVYTAATLIICCCYTFELILIWAHVVLRISRISPHRDLTSVIRGNRIRIVYVVWGGCVVFFHLSFLYLSSFFCAFPNRSYFFNLMVPAF